MTLELPNFYINLSDTLSCDSFVQVNQSVCSYVILKEKYINGRKAIFKRIQYFNKSDSLRFLQEALIHINEYKLNIESDIRCLVFERKINPNFYQYSNKIQEKIGEIYQCAQELYEYISNEKNKLAIKVLLDNAYMGDVIFLDFIKNICTYLDRMLINWDSWLHLSNNILCFVKHVVIFEVLVSNEFLRTAQTF